MNESSACPDPPHRPVSGRDEAEVSVSGEFRRELMRTLEVVRFADVVRDIDLVGLPVPDDAHDLTTRPRNHVVGGLSGSTSGIPRMHTSRKAL